MLWKKDSTKMELRLEWAALDMRESANISALCRRFGISRTTGYKWIRRYKAEGKEGLSDRSRRPRSSPNKTSDRVEEAVCAAGRQHPGWGGRKIRKVLRRKANAGQFSFGEKKVPAASTCTRILHRHDLIREEDTEKSASYQRFEKEHSNQLWQMDFKGDFLLDDETRCYPLTVVDDYSRFAVVLEACPNQQHETVKNHLSKAFRRYGLPERIITDRGAPWGVGMERDNGGPFYTKLSAWL
ncbi:transposase InsO family protein [Salinibacter ruber]|nr:transposase InsO family protein [Salinibacter ruber]